MASYMGKDKEAEVSPSVATLSLSPSCEWLRNSRPVPLWQVKNAVDGVGPPSACAVGAATVKQRPVRYIVCV